MRFTLSHNRRTIADADILDDMRRVASEIESHVLRQRDYGLHGKYAVKTAINRFGSWARAVEKARLNKSVDRDISDLQLHENLLGVWTHVGEQPSYSDVKKPISDYNVSTYERRFGSWRMALEAFVEWANHEDVDRPPSKSSVSVRARRTPRQPNLRLRFRVLNRDRFTCCACGVSPATKPGVVLNVDHIHAWSRGGETVESNLQTLCEDCNQGKSDLVER